MVCKCWEKTGGPKIFLGPYETTPLALSQPTSDLWLRSEFGHSSEVLAENSDLRRHTKDTRPMRWRGDCRRPTKCGLRGTAARVPGYPAGSEPACWVRTRYTAGRVAIPHYVQWRQQRHWREPRCGLQLQTHRPILLVPERYKILEVICEKILKRLYSQDLLAAYCTCYYFRNLLLNKACKYMTHILRKIIC